MRINHNAAALNMYHRLAYNNSNINQSVERLSSGLRINRASDDAAGLSISMKMRAQITGLQQANRNAQDAVSLIQTADSALNETHQMLQRMRELAVSAANDTVNESDRQKIQDEINHLIAGINQIANETAFNGQKLLDGSLAGAGQDLNNNGEGTPLPQQGNGHGNGHTNGHGNGKGSGKGHEIGHGNPNNTPETALPPNNQANREGGSLIFQIGANSGQRIKLNIEDMSTNALFAGSAVDFTTRQGAEQAITLLDEAVSKVSIQRSKLGAVQNRLQYVMNGNETAVVNLTAAESRIRDADMVKEFMEFTKNSILSKAAQSLLTQANQQPESVLKLLYN